MNVIAVPFLFPGPLSSPCCAGAIEKPRRNARCSAMFFVANVSRMALLLRCCHQ
ncbi:hypothetical protein KCP73_02460 [Salmonella enterica subsp. enterica]|nr:hypothetical protein KCP73_02460 [Salmonella enterica subsp. enterica]